MLKISKSGFAIVSKSKSTRILIFVVSQYREVCYPVKSILPDKDFELGQDYEEFPKMFPRIIPSNCRDCATTDRDHDLIMVDF